MHNYVLERVRIGGVVFRLGALFVALVGSLAVLSMILGQYGLGVGLACGFWAGTAAQGGNSHE